MTNSRIQEFHVSVAEDYDPLRFNKAYNQRLKWFKRAYVPGRKTPDMAVLEIERGTRRFETELVESASLVSAIEVSEKMLKQLSLFDIQLPSMHSYRDLCIRRKIDGDHSTLHALLSSTPTFSRILTG